MHDLLLEVITKLLPLQELRPLHLLCDVLQAPLPLQELAPTHFTVPVLDAACAPITGASVKANAAAVAIVIPVSVFVIFIWNSLCPY